MAKKPLPLVKRGRKAKVRGGGVVVNNGHNEKHLSPDQLIRALHFLNYILNHKFK